QWPCFYGIDFATRAELIATGLKVEEIRASIGADSLGYVSEDAMIEATGQLRSRLCTACFTGDYPIALPESSLLGKHFLEVLPGLEGPQPGRQDAEGVGTGVSGGAADALSRP
ncbi:MAG TPA: amidophosphoribosyltransferase, partial [Dermatophilaceae bacterium]